MFFQNRARNDGGGILVAILEKVFCHFEEVGKEVGMDEFVNGC